MPEVPVQLPLGVEDLPSEAIRGGAPADEAARQAAQLAFYHQLIAASPTPPTCLPDRGVHVFALSALKSGPCLCQSNNSPKGEQ
jgi:hypothetical protein